LANANQVPGTQIALSTATLIVSVITALLVLRSATSATRQRESQARREEWWRRFQWAMTLALDHDGGDGFAGQWATRTGGAVMTDTDSAYTDAAADARIMAARVKLNVDQRLHRSSSATVEQMAKEKTSDERRGSAAASR
jgi:hypothetical protein